MLPVVSSDGNVTEGSSSEGPSVAFPSPNVDIGELRDQDVLFGRGKNISRHVGNLRFHQIIDNYANRFEGCSRVQKTAICGVIVTLVKNEFGRFLKRDDAGSWEEVDDHTAR